MMETQRVQVKYTWGMQSDNLTSFQLKCTFFHLPLSMADLVDKKSKFLRNLILDLYYL